MLIQQRDMNIEQKLKFHGPYTMCSEKIDVLHDCPYASDEGMYLWAVKIKTGSYRISYIGETGDSYYKRTKDYVLQHLGGNYQVCDPDAMINGRHEVIWNGLWRKGTRNKLPEFLSRYETLAPIIKQAIFVQEVFVAPIKVDRRLRRRIEGALAFNMRENTEASSLLPNDIGFIRRKESEEPILVSISSEKKIDGMPEKIYV
jgi:hypothetical protein